MHLVKEDMKKQLSKHSKQPNGYIINKQYGERTEQRKASIVPGTRTCLEATKFG